jgi:hypothetical protein
MSTTISYSQADRKRLKKFEFNGSVSSLGVRRAIKMVKPICMICQHNSTDPNPGWWDECQHHPYERLVPKKIRVETFKEDEDGDLVLDEESTKASMKTKMVLIPNILEVMKHVQANDNNGPMKFKTLKGFKTLPEVGYNPMCEAYGCGRSWPTFDAGTRGTEDYYGVFCGRAHAELVAMKEAGLFSYLGASSDVDTQSEKSARRGMRALRADLNI